MSPESIVNFLRKVANEVPVVAAGMVTALTIIADTMTSMPAEATTMSYVLAVVMALLRFFVSPAFPQGSERARRQALRFDMHALEQMAREGDADAAAILVTLRSQTSDSTPV